MKGNVAAMNKSEVRAAIAKSWADEVIPSLSGLVALPALSPQFDPAWQTNGHLRAAVDHMASWAAARPLKPRTQIVELDDRSPVLFIDVPASPGAPDDDTVLMYGHLDKQPALGEWSEGLGPWQPVVRDGRLYGRGAVDDGYSGYAAITALEAVRAAGGKHGRTVIMLETAEESGSPELLRYLDHLATPLGQVRLVICLDAGGGTDYKRLWLTSSLRGLVAATLTVRVLEADIHSGFASGIIPSSFRIIRELLERVEDAATGRIKLPEMNVPIPPERHAEAAAFSRIDPDAVLRSFPSVRGMSAASDDLVELILNSTWRPALSVIGGDGLPESLIAPHVVRQGTSLRLSLRIPPTADVAAARTALEKTLTTNVPYGAHVTLRDFITVSGWSAPAPSPWLSAALDELTGPVFSEPYRQIGVGGGVPFMEMLSGRFPDADFVATGAVSADSNMHVPDEWLNLGYAEQVTAAVAAILDAQARDAVG
jgi:acetylornithine deacetylase/succinyl-diaminopimelate desuccinylase-like protein